MIIIAEDKVMAAGERETGQQTEHTGEQVTAEKGPGGGISADGGRKSRKAASKDKARVGSAAGDAKAHPVLAQVDGTAGDKQAVGQRRRSTQYG